MYTWSSFFSNGVANDTAHTDDAILMMFCLGCVASSAMLMLLCGFIQSQKANYYEGSKMNSRSALY